jgi:hypothetical protein
MKKLTFVLLALCLSVAVVGCDTDVSISSDGTGTSPTPADTASAFGLGEKVTVKDKSGTAMYTLVINSVKLTDERNQFADTDPAYVIVINYTYENLANESDLFISSMNFKVIDADGNVCATYPAGVKDYPQQTPMGAKCTGEEAYGLTADGKFKLMFYDNMFNSKADATFELTGE